MSMTIEELGPLLEDLYTNSRAYIVPWIEGPPGIGKTQTVRELAKKHHVKCVSINVFTAAPNEICGYVMPDKENQCMVYYDSEALSCLRDGDILLLDEIEKAPPAVLNALLTIVEDRKTPGGTKLADIFVVGCANNKPFDAIPLPQRQRFDRIELINNSRQTAKYLADKYDLDEESTYKIVRDLVSYDKNKAFNVLTPRKMEKAIQICLDNTSEVALNIFKHLYPTVIMTEVIQLCKGWNVRKVINQINDGMGEDYLDKADFEDVPMPLLLKKLEEDPQWDTIKTILETVKGVE